MLKLNEDKWLDIKHGLLEEVDYEMEEEDLYFYDDKSRSEIKNGIRHTYFFKKAGMEIKMVVDIKPKQEREESVDKKGNIHVEYTDIEGEYMYGITLAVQNEYGDWVDSSALSEGLLGS